MAMGDLCPNRLDVFFMEGPIFQKTPLRDGRRPVNNPENYDEAKEMKCCFCSETIPLEQKVSKRDTCPRCDRDLRCCKQCHFFDPGAYNGCREVAAERIVDKGRANFCDFYVPKGEKVGRGGIANRTQEAKAALEALFKKK